MVVHGAGTKVFVKSSISCKAKIPWKGGYLNLASEDGWRCGRAMMWGKDSQRWKRQGSSMYKVNLGSEGSQSQGLQCHWSINVPIGAGGPTAEP